MSCCDKFAAVLPPRLAPRVACSLRRQDTWSRSSLESLWRCRPQPHLSSRILRSELPRTVVSKMAKWRPNDVPAATGPRPDPAGHKYVWDDYDNPRNPSAASQTEQSCP